MKRQKRQKRQKFDSSTEKWGHLHRSTATLHGSHHRPTVKTHGLNLVVFKVDYRTRAADSESVTTANGYHVIVQHRKQILVSMQRCSSSFLP